MTASLLLLGGGMPRSVAGQRAPGGGAQDIPLLHLTELARIGGYDERPAYTFSRVSAASIVGESEIALVDGHSEEVRIFGIDGIHRRTFGGRGEGPGEFQSVRAVSVLPGSRLLVWDQVPGRGSVYHLDGTHVSTSAFARSGIALAWARFVGAFPDGSVVLRHDPSVYMFRNEPAGYRSEPVAFVHYSPQGELLDTLEVVHGPEQYLYHQGKSWGFDERIFEREVRGAVVGGVLVAGSTGAPVLTRTAESGIKLPSLALPLVGHPVTDMEIEAERSRRIREVRQEGSARVGRVIEDLGFALNFTELILDRLERMDAYDGLPPFRTVFAATDGTLWVEDYPSPLARTTSWILIRDRAIVGRVESGKDRKVIAAGHGVVLALTEDGFGVQTAIVLKIDPFDS